MVANDAIKIASGHSACTPQADDACRLATIRFLRELVAKGVVIVDEQGAAMQRFRSKLSGSGQPGVGDAFFRHLVDHEFDTRYVLRRPTPQDVSGEYEHFPKTPELQNFDSSDRLYVSIALAGKPKAKIANAVDSDYSHHKDALSASGVEVHELCGHCLKAAAKRNPAARTKRVARTRRVKPRRQSHRRA